MNNIQDMVDTCREYGDVCPGIDCPYKEKCELVNRQFNCDPMGLTNIEIKQIIEEGL